MPWLVVGHRPPAAAAGRGDPGMSVGWNRIAQRDQGLAAPCKFRRGEGHRLHHFSSPPAIMAAMDHDALSKSLFALPRVEADLLRIVARS